MFENGYLLYRHNVFVELKRVVKGESPVSEIRRTIPIDLRQNYFQCKAIFLLTVA